MAEVMNVRMVVGSRRDLGGDNPITILGMIAYPELPQNVEQMGSPAVAYVTLFAKQELVDDVQLNRDYEVTFTPLD